MLADWVVLGKDSLRCSAVPPFVSTADLKLFHHKHELKNSWKLCKEHHMGVRAAKEQLELTEQLLHWQHLRFRAISFFISENSDFPPENHLMTTGCEPSSVKNSARPFCAHMWLQGRLPRATM